MFFLNVGYKWALVEEARNGVILPSGNDVERVRRASMPEFKRVLLDPQLYLAGLPAADCAKVCARLGSYPWFGVELPGFESSSMSRREWQQQTQAAVVNAWTGQPPNDPEFAVRSAIEFQANIGCTHVILPSPLICEREDEAELQANWLEAGIRAAEELEIGQPLLATVALHEQVINDASFGPAGFLDAIVDQTVTRGNLDGVYIVIAQTGAAHPFDTSARVLGAYKHLASGFAGAGMEIVLTNFADVFGVACMGIGASAFANGCSQSLRRLSLSAFRDEGGGIALPFLYSHRVVAEFATQDDLDLLVARRALRVARDETVYSQPLLAELARGGTAATLPGWAASQNNIQTAQRHFITRMGTEGRRLALVARREREQIVVDWLEGAISDQLFLENRLGIRALAGRRAPVNTWLDTIQA